MERNTIREMLTPAARRRRRARFRLDETDTPAGNAEPWGLAGEWAGGAERPWYDRPPETEEAAGELDDAEPAMC